MSNVISHRRSLSRRRRFALFALGAALGSALGLVIGSALTFWLGEDTVRVLRQSVRRLSGGNDHPSFDLLLQ